MHKRIYTFRLSPTSHQRTLMENTLEVCRCVYNTTLCVRKTAWEEKKESISKFDTYNLLPEWKKENPEFTSVYSQVLQETQERVDFAFRHFFRRVKTGQTPGYPRFKGKGWYDSFTYPQYGGGVKLRESGLFLSKIGIIPVVLHRKISPLASIKRVTIKKKAGEWYASLFLHFSIFPICRNSKQKGIVGVDLGCRTFATLSDGSKIDNPKFTGTAGGKIAKAQRRLSRSETGTKKRTKARRALLKVWQKVDNQKTNFLHQESRKLVNRYNALVFEDLDVSEMVKKSKWKSLTKSILDSNWGQFVSLCSYKAENAGGKVIKVNPRNTTKTCSRCGALVEKTLNDRIHSCPFCLLKMDRDLNAAINILRLGQKSLASA